MGWLRKLVGAPEAEQRALAGPRVRGRARVAPASTRQRGETFHDGANVGSFSEKERLWVDITLTPVSAEDGLAVPGGAQQVHVSLPGWVVTVLYQAGTNEPLARELPAAVELPVVYDAATRAVVEVDAEAAASELEPYRSAAVGHFKRTESWLAPLRNVAALPGDAVDAGRGVVRRAKDAIGEMRQETAPSAGASAPSSWTTEEVEALRRNAAILAVRWEKRPKEREQARAAALQALPLQAEQVRAGSVSAADFDVMVMREEVSTAISPSEAAELRALAGLGA